MYAVAWRDAPIEGRKLIDLVMLDGRFAGKHRDTPSRIRGFGGHMANNDTQTRALPLKLINSGQNRPMVPNLPKPLPPVVSQSPVSHKPWTVALQIEDPEKAQKLRLISAVFGQKPGPYVTKMVLDWLDTIDVAQLQQEVLFPEAG